MGGDIFEAKGVQLHHIREVTEEDLDALQGKFKFHHLDYEDIRSQTPISKMDAYKHYIFFVFHVPAVNAETGYLYGEELYVFLSKEGLVTVTQKPIPALEEVISRIEKSTKFRSLLLGKGTAFCLQRILGEVFRNSLAIVADLTLEVRRLEEAIEMRHDKRLTVDLGHARRNILFLRQVIDPQRSILASLSHVKRSFVSEEMSVYFDDVHDILDTIWLSTDNLKLIVDGLFDVNEALLSHRTNEVVTLLTFLSAALMVPTLIAGFYGMNVPWLPFATDPRFVSLVYLVGLIGMVLVVVAIIRRSR
ncbi:MAG TPA: magnesium transporter CorA family protein [Patescibacteria group bacterium]|nr:magnesium transporter CorA family protein [Patescibacteria group bacterium]